jgi:hypothetical protein
LSPYPDSGLLKPSVIVKLTPASTLRRSVIWEDPLKLTVFLLSSEFGTIPFVLVLFTDKRNWVSSVPCVKAIPLLKDIPVLKKSSLSFSGYFHSLGFKKSSGNSGSNASQCNTCWPLYLGPQDSSVA